MMHCRGRRVAFAKSIVPSCEKKMVMLSCVKLSNMMQADKLIFLDILLKLLLGKTVSPVSALFYRHDLTEKLLKSDIKLNTHTHTLLYLRSWHNTLHIKCLTREFDSLIIFTDF